MDGVHDLRVQRDDVAVGEREHGVEVHGGAQLRHAATITRSAAPAANSAAATWVIACRELRSLMPDQHHAVADRHDVAALERRQAPVVLRGRPTRRSHAREVGMEV